jgi:erythromycin esterase
VQSPAPAALANQKKDHAQDYYCWEDKMDADTASQSNENAIFQWIAQNAVPIRFLEAGNGFADLQPLKQVLRDVKVVALGETTHATHEFFVMKHRLVEFLVSEMGFTTFTIEASFAACQPINEYVLTGKGDRAEVLSSQYYIPWDVQEFSDLLDWMRAYNQGMPDEKKVRFQGLDITRNAIGRQTVLNYLRKVAPAALAETELLFETIAREENKWPRRMDDAGKQILAGLYPQLQDLTARLAANQDDYIRASSAGEFDLALLYAQVMQKFIPFTAANFLPPVQGKGRSIAMAENLIEVVKRDPPGTKYILWAHNGHIRESDDPVAKPNLGTILRNQYGPAYYSIAFEFYQGSFNTRTVTQENLLGDLKAVTLPPSRADTLAGYLSHIQQNLYFLNLRPPAGDPAVDQWLDAPQPVHNVNWAYNPIDQEYLEMRPPRQFDGVIFFESTTPSRPTANALKAIAALEGL